MKGYFVPDAHLQKIKGYDALDDLYTHNPIIYSSVNELTHSLFNLRRDEHFSIDCSSPKWRQFFSELFIAYDPPEGLYGQSFDLADFLEGVFHSLLIFGKAFFKVDHSEKQTGQTGTIWTVQRIRWLAVETMKPIYDKSRIKRFAQQYSAKCEVKDLQGAKTEFLPDEIFFVEWVFDDDKTKGVSPLVPLIPHDKMNIDFLQLMERQAYAIANPQNHSYRVERAKHTSWEKAKRANEISEIEMRAILGTALYAPMTEYYEAYYFAKIRKRIALIREYLVNQFNAQVVEPLCKKNGLTEPARINLVSYLSSTDIEDLVRKFQQGQVSNNEVISILQKDMIDSTTPSKTDAS
jgi:hypothetical protein